MSSKSSWDAALDKLLSVRAADKVPADTYYYGVLTPAASLASYCASGCSLGLSPLAPLSAEFSRGSVGIGFFSQGDSEKSLDVMAHELGHAHGLPHAPCKTSNPGPFPYAGGDIGSWGWDLSTKSLLAPTQFKDMMTYCSPKWFSDFNYDKLFTRISSVHAMADFVSTDPERASGRYRAVRVGGVRGFEWGELHDLSTPPRGSKRRLSIGSTKAGRAAARTTLTGFFYPYAHGDGGLLLVREQALLQVPGLVAPKPSAKAPVELL